DLRRQRLPVHHLGRGPVLVRARPPRRGPEYPADRHSGRRDGDQHDHHQHGHPPATAPPTTAARHPSRLLIGHGATHQGPPPGRGFGGRHRTRNAFAFRRAAVFLAIILARTGCARYGPAPTPVVGLNLQRLASRPWPAMALPPSSSGYSRLGSLTCGRTIWGGRHGR